MDYESLAESVDTVREITRAQVAALIEDGFTERQARIIVTGIWAANEEDESAVPEEES